MLHHYHRSPAAASEPEPRQEPGQEPGQPSAAEAERPSAAEAAEAAHMGPWLQRLRLWRLCTRPYTRPLLWHHRPWPHWPWRRPQRPARPGRGRAKRPAWPPPPSPPASSTSSSSLLFVSRSWFLVQRS